MSKISLMVDLDYIGRNYIDHNYIDHNTQAINKKTSLIVDLNAAWRNGMQ